MEKIEKEDLIKTLSNLNLNFSDFEFKETIVDPKIWTV